eukprot:15133632-Alexandrium_andersonii.AAC.1
MEAMVDAKGTHEELPATRSGLSANESPATLLVRTLARCHKPDLQMSCKSCCDRARVCIVASICASAPLCLKFTTWHARTSKQKLVGAHDLAE